MRVKKAMARDYRDIADDYVKATGAIQYTVADVVEWAMANDRLGEALSRKQVAELHAARMSESLREHTTKDARGRTVRLRHCAIVSEADKDGHPVQRLFWSDVYTASDDFLVLSLTQRRDTIQGDVERLAVDLEFINALRQQKQLRPIQLNLHFRA